jgi:hypothetical protein
VHDPAVHSLSSSARVVTDRIEVRVRYGRASEAPGELPDATSPPVSVRTRKRSSSSRSSLAEVEKILGSQPTLPAFKAVEPEKPEPVSSRYSVTNPRRIKH